MLFGGNPTKKALRGLFCCLCFLYGSPLGRSFYGTAESRTLRLFRCDQEFELFRGGRHSGGPFSCMSVRTASRAIFSHAFSYGSPLGRSFCGVAKRHTLRLLRYGQKFELHRRDRRSGDLFTVWPRATPYDFYGRPKKIMYPS